MHRAARAPWLPGMPPPSSAAFALGWPLARPRCSGAARHSSAWSGGCNGGRPSVFGCGALGS
eukprot:9612266-Lingulodinium_polyedra.AAC.1